MYGNYAGLQWEQNLIFRLTVYLTWCSGNLSSHMTRNVSIIINKRRAKFLIFAIFHIYCSCLLSSDIRSSGSIAIAKKFDFDFFMVYDSISLPHSKKLFQKIYVCVCVCVCVCMCLSVCLSVCLPACLTVAEHRA